MRDDSSPLTSGFGRLHPAAIGTQAMVQPAAVRKSRLDYVQNFRGAAIICIIVTHCLSAFDWSEHAQLESLLKIALANGTIFFIFISGFLFEHLSKQLHLAKYWGNKLRHVVLPYIVVSVPALLLFTTALHREGVREGFYEQAIWRQWIEFLATGAHLAPLWFVPTILVFYLAAPVLRLAFRDARSFAMLPLLFLIPVFVSRGDHDPVQAFAHFLPIWVLGMACRRFSGAFERAMRQGLLWLALLALVFAAAEMAFAQHPYSMLSYFGKACLSLVLLELFKRLGHRANPWLWQAGALSFGLFFIHSYVISAAKMAESKLFGHLATGSLPGLLVLAAIALLCTMLGVAGIRRVLGPRRSRLLIGA
jgi:peptidoglycan/LPS O-acetylase OafA/YrhL